MKIDYDLLLAKSRKWSMDMMDKYYGQGEQIDAPPMLELGGQEDAVSTRSNINQGEIAESGGSGADPDNRTATERTPISPTTG